MGTWEKYALKRMFSEYTYILYLNTVKIIKSKKNINTDQNSIKYIVRKILNIT